MSYLIEDIEEQSLVAEMNVINALMASYVKEATMLEYTSKEVVQECFYQEGEKWDKFKQDANAPVFGNKGEKLLKRILMFIPRLIAAIISKFKKNKPSVGAVLNTKYDPHEKDVLLKKALNKYQPDKECENIIRKMFDHFDKENVTFHDCVCIMIWDDYIDIAKKYIEQGNELVNLLKTINPDNISDFEKISGIVSVNDIDSFKNELHHLISDVTIKTTTSSEMVDMNDRVTTTNSTMTRMLLELTDVCASIKEWSYNLNDHDSAISAKYAKVVADFAQISADFAYVLHTTNTAVSIFQQVLGNLSGLARSDE